MDFDLFNIISIVLILILIFVIYLYINQNNILYVPNSILISGNG